MRVLLDTTYARRAPLSGTGVYARQLGRALRESGEVELVERANPRRRPAAGGGAGSLRNLGGDVWWSAVQLPRLARACGAQVIHHVLPALSPAGAAAQVVTVHDLAFERHPELFAAGFRRYAHLAHRAAARRAGAVICVSQATAADVRELWGVAEERLVVAPHGPGQLLPADEWELEPGSGGGGAPSRGHFLYVGDAEPRKNLSLLLAAHARYRAGSPAPLELVLAGGAAADQAGVRVIPVPTVQSLVELLRNAVALVQPSLYEGFGLTALEAMQAGVPVIAARSAGLQETCGEAALTFAARSADELAGCLARMAGDQDLRRGLARAGRARARAFSWERSAQAHIAAYSLALARPAARRRPGGRPTRSALKP